MRKVLFTAFSFSMIFAAVITIPVDYETIQEGINASVNNDLVLIQPGTYFENINITNKNITVGSLFVTTGDDSYLESTILDGSNSGSVVIFGGGTNHSPSLVGLTLTNGFAFNGGGINCMNNARPDLLYLVIHGNTAYYNGGGLYFSNAQPEMYKITVSDNVAQGNGGGLFCSSTSLAVYNTILWNNSPQEIYFYEHANWNTINLSYCDIMGGAQSVETNNNGDVFFVYGNINANPMFVQPGADYQLQTGSPCINTGDPGAPLDDDGTRIEIGALYFSETFGCTDPDAVNYNPSATNDDDSCEYAPVADDVEISISEDGYFTMALNAVDPDGDEVSYSISEQPEYGTVTITDSSLTYYPDPNFNGEDELIYMAVDTNNNFDTAVVSITVIPVNDPPSFMAEINDQVMDFNTSFSMLIFAQDADNDDLYYYAQTDNNNMQAEMVGNSLTLTPAQNWGSSVNVSVSVADRNVDDPNYNPDTDGQVLMDHTDFNITVNLVGEYVSIGFGTINYANHTINIYVNNQMELAGFQFEIENRNETSDALFQIDGAEGGRAGNAGFIVEFQPATSEHGGFVVGYNAAFMPPLSPGSGTLTTISYSASGWVGPEICLQNIIMTVPDGSEANIFVEGCTTYEFGKGDMVQNGQWDVLDLISLINIVIFVNESLSDYDYWAADMSGDGQITVTDAIYLVNQIMGTPLGRTQTVSLADLEINSGNVKLNANGDVAGFQLDYQGEIDLTQLDVSENVRLFHDNNKIIILSMDGTGLQNKDLFSYTGQMEIKSNAVVDWYGNTIQADFGTGMHERVLAPEQFELLPAYPNPFNPETTLSYTIPEMANVTLKVLDILGREIDVLLLNESHQPGNYHTVWNAASQPSGIYFVVFTANEYSETSKLMLIK